MGEKTATRWTERDCERGRPPPTSEPRGDRRLHGDPNAPRDPAASPEASPASCPGTGVSELTSWQAEQAPAQVCRARVPPAPKPPF